MPVNDILAPNAKNKKERDLEVSKLFNKFRKSPRFWVEYMFGFTYQPVKPEFEEELRSCIHAQAWLSVKAEWFDTFVKGKHITWQQLLVLEAVGYAVRGQAQNRISISSGHGIGKSTTCAWLMLWYLMCYANCRVGATAPSRDQLHDVLWTEAKKWIDKMPTHFQLAYEWTGDYIRIKEDRDNWWARARTARPDSPEALAGLHAEHVLIIVDEASGVHQAIFNTAEGSLTDKNTLIIMISNPTRLYGYFYDSHHSDKDAWQRMSFSSLDSPVVDNKFVQRVMEKNGVGSDEFRIRVEGKFPNTDSMDTEGYVSLIPVEKVLKTTDHTMNIGRKRLGVDVAGSGDDNTVWVIRDSGKAKVIHEEKTSNDLSVVTKTITLMENYGIKADDVFLDLFGEGAKVAQKLAQLGHMVNAVNVGDPLDRRVEGEDDKKRFRNKRAHAYWRMKDWMIGGGELVVHEKWDEQISSIRYRRNISGSIEIMSKLKMRKLFMASPDHLDALMLTFTEPDYSLEEEWEDSEEDYNMVDDDIYGGTFS
jgi:hypothetical protein